MDRGAEHHIDRAFGRIFSYVRYLDALNSEAVAPFSTRPGTFNN
jgi:hypothetical protein